MSALKEKVQTLLNNFLGEKDSLTLEEFLNLFEELKPDYDLSEDEVRDIFEMTDEHGEGLISKSEVERILGAVLTSEDDEKKSFVSDYVNELKAGLAQSAEKGSYTSVLEDFETVNQENNVQDHENTNSALKILHHLDLDKIRELKNIYILCNTQHQGYVELGHLRKVIPTMDNLTCEPDEILELFEYIAEGESRIIPKTTFSNLMGELEKKLLDYLVTEENEIMDDLDHPKADEKEPSEYNTRNFNGVVSSEIFSNSSDKEEYDSANSASEADVKHQTRLIAQKVKNIIEGIKSKTRTEDVITMLHEIVNVSSSLEHQHNEGRMKALEQELDEQKNVVDGLNSKVYNFQFTLKNQEQTIYKLQADNDELNQRISVAKNERHLKEHAEAELKEKNNEIVRLERNLNEMRNERSNFIRNIQTIENDKHTLMDSYKELELLIKKNEQDKREQENIVGAELKKLEERISIERDSLNSQTKTLKDEKASLENDIRNLQATLHEYREQMSTTKEFVDNLNLQKKDLEKQIHKLNDEQANLALEVNRLAFSVQNSPRKNLEFISPFGDSGLTTRHIDQQYNSGFTTMSTPRALNFQFDLKRVEEEEKGHFDIQPEMPKITEIKEELAIPEKKVESFISEKKPSVPKTPKTEPKTIQASESFIKPNAPRTSAKKPNAFTMNLLRPIEPVRAVEPVRPKAPAYNIEVIEASPVRRARKSTMHKHNELLAIIDKRKITMDYLSIKDKAQIISILQKYNEKMEDRIFYSDYVYDIQKEGQREHRIILLTGEALYCLNKNYQVQRRTPLNQVHRVTINQSSVGICAFHVYDDHDYLIDTYKRLELIIFLKTVFKYKGMRPFAIFYEKNFLIHNKGASSSQHVYHYNRKMFNPELQSTYQNVQKVKVNYGLKLSLQVGELYLKEWSIFNPWNKYFFMLTHVGLFYFKEVGNLKPLGFIPILDYLLVNKKESVASDKHEFRIKFQYSDFSVSLAAESELEKLEWVVAIHQVQNKAQPKDILTLIKDA